MSVCRQSFRVLLVLLSVTAHANGQTEPSELKIFGYFQPQWIYESDSGTEPARNSFVLQQLNLFLQKDLGTGLTSFVNFEAVNSYSSDQQWGSFRLEEAWVRYRQSRNLSVRLGLQIPVFNNLNEIKNRTPLIPYVVRPLVYESSFVDVIPVRVYVPQQAYVQVFGWLPVSDVKIDYAAYLGNTELVNSGFNSGPDGRPIGQTGVDTTEAVLVGGRAGIRYQEFKAGLSTSFDRSAVFQGAADITGLSPRRYLNVPRRRLGADASFHYQGFSVESEWINVGFDEPAEIDLDLTFYYVSAGYRFTERLLAYGGYWQSHEKTRLLQEHQEVKVRVPNIGVAYILEEQITLKAQYAHVDVDVDVDVPSGDFGEVNTFDYFTLAVSVTF